MLLHELHHVRYAHHLLFGSPDPLKNLAFDALVNAQIARVLRKPEYLSFFRAFYPDPAFPMVLLTPPPLWEYPNTADWSQTPEARRIRENVFGQLDDSGADWGWKLYQRLYAPQDSVLFEELMEFFRRYVEHGARDIATLLGSHGFDQDSSVDEPNDGHRNGDDACGKTAGDSGRADEDKQSRLAEQRRRLAEDPYLDAVTKRMSGWTQVAGKGIGFFTDLETFIVPRLTPRQRAMGILKRLCVRLGIYQPLYFRRTLRPDASDTVTWEPRFSAADRTYWARSLLWGQPPLLGQNERTLLRKTWESPPVCHVYLDVSGSMDDELPWLLPVFHQLARMGLVRVFQFSNAVAPLCQSDLARGEIRTTGGTDLDCVLRHVLDTPPHRRPPQILVVTDGCFQRPRNLEDFWRTGVRLHLALTGPREPVPYASSVTPLYPEDPGNEAVDF